MTKTKPVPVAKIMELIIAADNGDPKQLSKVFRDVVRRPEDAVSLFAGLCGMVIAVLRDVHGDAWKQGLTEAVRQLKERAPEVGE